MSDTNTITDAAILAAWGGADGMDGQNRESAATQIREAVEMAGDLPATLWFDERSVAPWCETVDVASVRDRLGGWDAVWRAVLIDEGFDETGVGEWFLGGPKVWVWHVDGVWTLHTHGFTRPLRSPADLRVRVGHAKELFKERA